MVDDYHPENKGVIELLQTPFQFHPEFARRQFLDVHQCVRVNGYDDSVSQNSLWLIFIQVCTISHRPEMFNDVDQ